MYYLGHKDMWPIRLKSLNAKELMFSIFAWADVRKLSKTKLPTSNFSILQIFNPTFSSMPFHAGSNPAVVFLSCIDHKKLLKLKHSSLDEKTLIVILKWRYVTNYHFVLIAANIRHIWILIIVNFRLYQSTHVCNWNFFDVRENVSFKELSFCKWLSLLS